MLQNNLKIYNTLSRKKEAFEPIHAPFVGMYVCGPTVYGEAHLGHARPAITFDVVFRYLKYLGYHVRYVRNITDVGHLTSDADEGEDKILKKAKQEQLEPMEVVQFYTNSYHKSIEALNCLPPSIEPHASGHIIEQQEMVQKLLNNGFAYQNNGSVYFDVETYNRKHHYGKLSGRNIDELYANTRELDGQTDKKNPFDFAVWKKAEPEHLQRWKSSWGEGFPGWHLECSVMSTKYLGETFDIHGGGMDLLFPHHECEIAQSVGASGKEAVKYWMHNNMITINGQKMGKSLGNFITLTELFTGNHKLLHQAYSGMTIRFFILQAHYRSTLDFSNEALQASEKGLQRLLKGAKTLENLKTSQNSSFDLNEFEQKCFEAINDDFNTPILIAQLFEQLTIINRIAAGTEQISPSDLEKLQKLFSDFLFEILGLKEDNQQNTQTDDLEQVMNILLEIRQKAKENKDWQAADFIRNKLNEVGITLKDNKEGVSWEKS
jgi:cysteinyl-tRNA synthetase